MHETTRALADLLRSSGLITQDEAIAALRAEGHEVDDDSWLDFWFDEDLGPAIDIETDGGTLLAWLPSLLDGRVFTHRLTAEEIADNRIEIVPDLSAISSLLNDQPFDTIAGTPVFADDDDVQDVLQLPAGSLDRYRDGDLLGIRVTAEGFVLETVTTAPAEWTEDEIERLLAAFDEEAGGIGEFDDDDLPPDIEPVELAALLHRLLLSNPDLWTTPTQPVAHLLERAHLELNGEDWVVRRGAAVTARAIDQRLSVLEFYDLDEVQTSAAYMMIIWLDHVDEVIDAWETAGRPADAKPELRVDHLIPLLDEFAEPAVGLALCDVGLNGSPHRAMALRGIVKALLPSTPRRSRPAMHYLLGRCLDLMGHIDESEPELEQAVSLDSAYWPALRALASNASDRGDARRAVSLLQRSGVTADDNEFAMVSRYLPAEHPELGRNSPCWCGSGRKFKVCHGSARTAEARSFTLAERRDWVYYKAARWAQEVAGRALIVDLAQVRCLFSEAEDAMLKALTDPLTLDVALFEGGLLADFLEVRGPLLPTDEQLLAASWLTTPRSLYEVGAVRPGQGFELRDVRTGDRHQVVERSGSKQVKVGMLVCVHLLGSGADDDGTIFGGIDPVPDQLRDATLEMLDRAEADPYVTIEVLTRRFLPPEVRTAEGDELRLCTAKLVVSKPKDLVRWLDRELETNEDGVWDWTVPADFGERVLASVQREGGWTVTATSERRFDGLLQRLQSAVPGVTVGHQSRLSIDQVAQQHPTPPTVPDINDPAVAEMLSTMIRGYEERWLDESIPALGGSTPRQAADDPTRRGDLIRLLGSFEGYSANPGAMKVGRLRAALGLDVDAATGAQGSA